MSDIGHEETDKELEKLERKIDREYGKAIKGAKEKVVEYYKEFDKQNQKWIERVDKGEVSEQKYKDWLAVEAFRKGQVEGIVKSLEQDLSNARSLAYSMINDHIPNVYAINANWTEYQIEKDINMDISFTLYDRQTVERLIRDNPKLLPKGSPPPNAKKWSQAKLRSEITQGILIGESNQNIAKRLEKVFGMDENASIRNARTMTTSAECAGRLDSYRRAEKMGIGLIKIWMATLDTRTRHEHRMVDGQRREIEEPFDVDGHEMMFPADPIGEPYLVYNCRCTTISQVKGFEYDIVEGSAIGGGYKSYEEWKYAKAKNKPYFGDVSKVPLPSEPIELVPNVPPVEEWIDLCKQNTEAEMLAWEDRGFQGTLTRSERNALEEYTGSSFKWMNGYLRIVSSGNDPIALAKLESRYGPIDEKRKQLIDETINALNKLHTERDMVVRRGTDVGDLAGLFMEGDFKENENILSDMLWDRKFDEIREMFVGAVGEYGGFTSTSSLWERGFNGSVEVVMFVPKGTSASSIMRISQFGKREGETLFNAGTTVRCLDVVQSDDRHAGSRLRVYLEVLSNN